MDSNRIVCSRCCMDKSAKEIVFDKDGVCNFCHQAQKSLKEIEVEKPNLNKIIEKIKKYGKGKTFDALIGLSGGIDSSYTLHHLVQMSVFFIL